jgi:hypothetical protein
MEQSLNLSLNISHVLVPLDFEAKVRELTGRDDYKFQRGSGDAKLTVMAKTLEDENGVVIVISPWLYVPDPAPLFDTMVRSFILSHELAHVMNKKRLPKVAQESSAVGSYLGNLYYMFDEYFADRFSYQLTEKIFTPTEAWKKFNDNNVLGYINPESHPLYYAEIKSEIEKFRLHGDVGLFMKRTKEAVSNVSVLMTHGFAAYHQHQAEHTSLQIPITAFVNEKTFALMDYFKKKYKKGETDLHDGIDQISNYLTNFGLRFEERPNNKLYAYVLDI